MNFSKLLAALQAEATKIWAQLQPLVTQIKPMIQAAEEEIATLALNAVAMEAPKVLSGQEKFSSAVSTVVTSLGAQGKAISIATAQAAVQSSYNFLSAALHPPAK